jgi:ADP-ribose pyrophosphatase
MEADAWIEATSCFTTIGMADEVLHVFLATGLREVERPDTDEDERIEIVRWPRADLDELIDTSVDAKTLIALLWLRRAST